MNYKTYINYIKNGNIHAGIYIDDFVTYVRDAEPMTSHQLDGYIEVTLKDGVERSWASIEDVVQQGLAQIGTIYEQQVYSEQTPNGVFELLVRPSVPRTATDIVQALKDVYSRIESEGTTVEMPNIA